jgi:hypothetical protein
MVRCRPKAEGEAATVAEVLVHATDDNGDRLSMEQLKVTAREGRRERSTGEARRGRYSWMGESSQ